MSRFYGTLTGQARTIATRRGGPSSGISAHPRGWDVGVVVDGYVGDNDSDTFDVRISGGSNDSGPTIPLATIQRMRDGSLRVRLSDSFGGDLYSADSIGTQRLETHPPAVTVPIPTP